MIFTAAPMPGGPPSMPLARGMGAQAGRLPMPALLCSGLRLVAARVCLALLCEGQRAAAAAAA